MRWLPTETDSPSICESTGAPPGAISSLASPPVVPKPQLLSLEQTAESLVRRSIGQRIIPRLRHVIVAEQWPGSAGWHQSALCALQATVYRHEAPLHSHSAIRRPQSLCDSTRHSLHAAIFFSSFRHGLQEYQYVSSLHTPSIRDHQPRTGHGTVVCWLRSIKGPSLPHAHKHTRPHVCNAASRPGHCRSSRRQAHRCTARRPCSPCFVHQVAPKPSSKSSSPLERTG